MPEAKPTYLPLPWKAGQPEAGNVTIRAANGVIACVTYGGCDVGVNRAELIVRAVNSHQQLVEALKECEALFKAGHAISRFDWGNSALRSQDIQELNELPGKIRAALSAAEGKKDAN